MPAPFNGFPDELLLGGDSNLHQHQHTDLKHTDGPNLKTTAFDGLSKITVGATPPVTPSIGDLWVDIS